MNSKTSSWERTLGSFDIHVSGGREKFLNEVARCYETMFPARADFFKRAMKDWRDVTVEGAEYKDQKNREYMVKIRVPTELWLFIKRWIPDFGDDDKDIQLLRRVWCDLVRPAKERRRVTRLA